MLLKVTPNFSKCCIHYFLLNAIGRFSHDLTGTLIEITVPFYKNRPFVIASYPLLWFFRNSVSEVFRNGIKYYCCHFFSLNTFLFWKEIPHLRYRICIIWTAKPSIQETFHVFVLIFFPPPLVLYSSGALLLAKE